MLRKLAYGALVGSAVGAPFGYFVFDGLPGAVGLCCSITACIWGAQFSSPEDSDEES